MKQRSRNYYTAKQRTEIWDLWKQGELLVEPVIEEEFKKASTEALKVL